MYKTPLRSYSKHDHKRLHSQAWAILALPAASMHHWVLLLMIETLHHPIYNVYGHYYHDSCSCGMRGRLHDRAYHSCRNRGSNDRIHCILGDAGFLSSTVAPNDALKRQVVQELIKLLNEISYDHQQQVLARGGFRQQPARGPRPRSCQHCPGSCLEIPSQQYYRD